MDNQDKLKKTPILPSIGISGLLFNSQGQVLLIQRNQAPAKGQWSLPGGRQEPGETMIEACCREFYEETGLEVRAKHIVAIVERQVEGFHYIIVDFLVELLDASRNIPTPQSDATDARWINLGKLDGYAVVGGLMDIIARAYYCHSTGLQVGLCDVNSAGSDFILPAVPNGI